MTQAFPDIGRIAYEGPATKTMLAFRHYDADALIEGVPMRDHFRFAVSYSACLPRHGQRPLRPRHDDPALGERARSLEGGPPAGGCGLRVSGEARLRFLLFSRPRCAPEGATLAESNSLLDAVADALERAQQRTGKKLLWGTANLFSHPALRPRRRHEPQCGSLRLTPPRR